MIVKEVILKLHELSIIKYGGSHGIRDEGLMESAIARPYQTFGGEDLYPTGIEKAAAIAESIIINHPFVDGNKRTGYLAMLAILDENKLELIVSNDAIYAFVIKISTGEIKFDKIVEWLKQNTSSL
ncbi:type II toxin-antitoxin system death-on-curing family toxin [Ferruginibacter sp.]|jgi:death on curing protein|nr:type II toxin-antitoxin system death-on-curing family toxin [Ferruginibacter sp.]